MTARTIGLLAAAALALGLPAMAQAAEWEEILVTVGETRAVEMAEERTVMSYFATGAYALSAGGVTVPAGSYECAGMIDADADGMALTLSCVTTDPDGDKVYLSVARGKDAALAPNQGRYTYDGGTGKWLGFTADCTYEVHRQASGHAIEFGHCVGDALPPLLN